MNSDRWSSDSRSSSGVRSSSVTVGLASPTKTSVKIEGLLGWTGTAGMGRIRPGTGIDTGSGTVPMVEPGVGTKRGMRNSAVTAALPSSLENNGSKRWTSKEFLQKHQFHPLIALLWSHVALSKSLTSCLTASLFLRSTLVQFHPQLFKILNFGDQDVLLGCFISCMLLCLRKCSLFGLKACLPLIPCLL